MFDESTPLVRFLLVFRTPYLMLIAALMLANVVNTLGEFILGSGDAWVWRQSLFGVVTGTMT